MYKNLNIFIIYLLLTCQSVAYSQVSKLNINQWQDSLAHLGKAVFSDLSEPQRIEKNFTFVKTLVSALKEKNSFAFEFDQLTMISIVNSPDQKFRIFSWNVPLNDGSFLYYGAIQFHTADGTLKLIPLLDKTFEIEHVDKDITSPQKWFGAQYYEMVKLSENSYALLGWKGHHQDYSIKVIEILNILDSGVLQFGKNVFTDNAKISRKIFQYTAQASMYLHYNEELKRIEFDHLVPADPKLIGNYKYYGPDLTFDSYEIEHNQLISKTDIEIQSPKRGDENKFLAPDRKQIKKQSGF